MLVQHPTASSASGSNSKAGYRTQPVGSSVLPWGGAVASPGNRVVMSQQILKASQMKWVPKSDGKATASDSSNRPAASAEAENERVYSKDVMLQALAEVMPVGGFGDKSRDGRPVTSKTSEAQKFAFEAHQKTDRQADAISAEISSKSQQQKSSFGGDATGSNAASKKSNDVKSAESPFDKPSNRGLFGGADPNNMEPMKVPISGGLGTMSPGLAGIGAQEAAMSLLRATWQAQLWSPAVSPLKGPVMPSGMPDMLSLDPLGYPQYPYGGMGPYLDTSALEPPSTDDSQATTFMLRNIPNKYSRAMLMERLDQLGFKGTFDFLYMPIDFGNRCNVGYAFVNFRNQAAASQFLEAFNGVESKVCLPGFNSAKICEVTLARMQGLTANVDHLRDSAVMDQLQDHEEWQPLLFDTEGNPMPFPKRRKGSADDSSEGGKGGSRRNSDARSNSKRSPNIKAQTSPGLAAKGSPNLGPQKDPLPDHGFAEIGDSTGNGKNKKEKVKKSPKVGPAADPYGPPSPYIGASPPPMLQWTPEICTVMLRNIPNKYTRTMLLERLEQLNFKGGIDFLYMPIDFANKCNVGYAFVNFRDPYQIPRFLEVFHAVESKTCLPGFNSSKVCEVTAARVQGLNANVAHIRDSTAMRQLANHPEWQPLVFDENGESIPFLNRSPSLSASAPEFIPSPMLQASAAEFIPENSVPEFMLDMLEGLPEEDS